MSILTALNSEDLLEVKKYRGVIKGQLTVSIDKLKERLETKVEAEFDHSAISKSEVAQIGAKLATNFEHFTKLHEKYSFLRESGKSEVEELLLAKEDERYT